MYNEIYPTFIEDQVIMGAQQGRIDLDPDRGLVAIHADGVLALARMAVDRLIEKERPASQAAE